VSEEGEEEEGNKALIGSISKAGETPHPPSSKSKRFALLSPAPTAVVGVADEEEEEVFKGRGMKVDSSARGGAKERE